jgi:20S proteasome alpha/beta subunit
LYTTRRTENETSLFISLHDDNDKPLIQCVDYNGTSFRIRGYESIGSGDSEAEYFLRTLYRHEYDVEKLAEICSFVIQLISESAINNSVRVSSEYPPECYIIQHSKPYRYENPYLYDINHNRILSLHHNLNNLFTEKDILVSEAIKRYY